MNSFIKKAQSTFEADFTVGWLKVLIIAVALVFILLAMTIDNPYILAFILAYIVLP